MSIFVFYSKSADKMPGKGIHEELDTNDNFKELIDIKDWRRKLSNMWISPFEIGERKYNSVEHLYHSSKFWKDFPKFAETFTLESESPWSVDPFKSKTAGKAGRKNKNGKVFSTQLFKLPNVYMRDDFYGGYERQIMALGWRAKFTQDPELKKLLLATKNAQLYHLVTERGKPSKLQRWEKLEELRSCIKKYPKAIFQSDDSTFLF